MNANTQVSPGIGDLPSQFSVMGGCIVDIVGTNGHRWTGQISGQEMFSGWVQTSQPWLHIATIKVNPADVLAALGGGISAANIRLTLYDGDSGSPNPVYEAMFGSSFGYNASRGLPLHGYPYAYWSPQPANYDFDGGENLFIGFEDTSGNPVNCGYMGQTTTYRLDSSGDTTDTFTGFPGVYALTDPFYSSITPPSQYLPPFPTTGWFSVPSGQLDAMYASLLTGTLYIGLHDITPGDQYFDFTQALAEDVPDIPLFPPSVILTASPTSVTGSGTVTLSWTTIGCSAVNLDNNLGLGLSTPGSVEVVVSQQTTFNATGISSYSNITNPTASVTVTWSRPPVAITSFVSNPASLTMPGTATLSWTVVNADTVTLDGTTVPAIGTQQISFTEESTQVHTLIGVQNTPTTTSASATCSVTLAAVPLAIVSTSPLPQASTALPGVLFQFDATGGFGTFNWSATGLPAGLTLTEAGVLSGTLPLTATETYTFPVTVSCPGVVASKTVTFSLPFVQAALAITTTAIDPARESEAYSFQMESIYGLGPKTWSISSGTLPPGLSITSAGVIQGTPTEYGYWDFTTEVSTATETAQRSFELMVKIAWSLLDPIHKIFYRVKNVDGTLALDSNGDPISNDPYPQYGGDQVFAEVAVGFTVGLSEFTMTDIRARGGGLAPEYQTIPEADNFWDLGHLDGRPFPTANTCVIDLPIAILDQFTRDQLLARIEQILPLGTLPVIRFYDAEGNESV